jgi:hypothetical protein
MSKFGAVNTATNYGTTGLSVAGSVVTAAAHGAALTGSAATVAAIGSAATIVGLVATPVLILLAKIFHGADPRQVPASQIEQAFEAGANNLYAVGKAGMISRDEAIAGMRAFLKKGEEFYKLPDIVLGKAEEKGLANMRVVIGKEIAAAERDLAVTRARLLDVKAARPLYVKFAPGRWYRESVDAAAKLADAYLASLPTNAVEKAASILTAPVSESFPVPVWAAGLLAALVGAGVKRLRA